MSSSAIVSKHKKKSVRLPEDEEAQVRELHRLLRLGRPALLGSDRNSRIELPNVVYLALRKVVSALKQGKTVAIVPEDDELTTQMAANFLGVSRPHLIKLLEEGRIAFHKTGTHRRLLLRDVKQYQIRRDAERRKILRQLSRDEYADGSYLDKTVVTEGSDE